MQGKMLWAAFLGLAVLLAPNLSAQTPKKGGTSLTGTVVGKDGKPVANASVSCQSSGGMSPHAVRTDRKGRFLIPALRQDSYDLRASANGIYSDWQRNIPLRRGQSKEVTLRLTNESPKPAEPTALPAGQQIQPQP